MAAELHVGDVGTRLRASLVDNGSEPFDLTGAGVIQFILSKPSGTVVELDCTVVGSAEDGVIQFTTVASTLDEAGFYTLQAYIEVSTNKWHTDYIKFRVYPNLN